MKLVALMSIVEYSDALKKILVKEEVSVFSEIDIEGFRLDTRKSIEENWFSATQMDGIYSSLYFAFVYDEKAKSLLKAVQSYNEENSENNLNPIRGFLLNVEDHV